MPPALLPGDGAVEDGARAAALHQERFRAEHLGNLGEDSGTAARDEPVAEAAHERVGREAGEAVGAAALEPHDQFRGRHGHALLRAVREQFGDHGLAALELVSGILRAQESNVWR